MKIENIAALVLAIAVLVYAASVALLVSSSLYHSSSHSCECDADIHSADGTVKVNTGKEK